MLAQLITNDSIQTNQLVDKINSYITSPVINAALVRQSAEEALHNECYSIMAEDICQDSDRIYNMHFEDNELYLKNKAVESMYLSLYDGNDPSKEDLLLCFVANQILEELVFPGGFVIMYSLGNKMVGSAEMIREINKDESLSHVPLFAFIFKQAVNEEFDGIIPNAVKEKARDMIIRMTDAEKRWTKYASKGLLGFSDRSIDIFIESRANSVCKNLGLELIYKEEKVNPLGELLRRNLRGETDSRQNFFEANVTEYSKTGYVNDL